MIYRNTILVILFFLLLNKTNSQEKEFELRNNLKTNNLQRKTDTYYQLADYYYEKTGKGDSLISIGNKVISLLPKANFIGGNYYIASGNLINKNYNKAEDSFLKSLKNAEKENDKKWLAKIHNRLGSLYQNKDDLEKSIYHLLEAIKFSEKEKDFQTLASAYYGISVIYSTQNQTEKQLVYLNKSLIICKEKKSIPPITKNVIYGSASQQYAALSAEIKNKNFKDSSFIYAKKALSISTENQLKQRIPSDLIVVGLYYINNGNYDKGLQYLTETLGYSDFMKDEAKLNAYQILAHIYRAKKEKKLCYTYLDSLNNLSIKKRPYYGSIISKYTYTSYKYFKDYNLAFDALDNYFKYEEKKKEIEQNKTINELETKYQTQLKDSEIKRLTFFLIIAIAVILLVLLLFFITRLKKSKKSNIALKEAIKQQLKLEKELINVRNNIAQDFHDDLGNKLARISFLSRLVEDELSDSNPNIKSKVTQVKEDTVSLYVGTKDFIFSLKPNSDFLEEVVTYLSDFGEDYFSETEIQFILDKQINLNKKLPHYWSKQLIYIFKEAMTNAFKHSKCSKLTLKFEFKNNTLIINCIDNGKGISKTELSSKNGLLNMNKRADKIKGKLTIESEINVGTTISFTGKIS